ncbi:putative F-box protein [Prunus yedoensis var. nudiflora]|uniref:Putative F-box protein n=1 Tax=Prunus yedoensis var. nudiflora TaxID=2094558 RepID=A0A314XZB1_PRUYE|nr:putative F-box protein [Prunus yedoensis var. nudiflora]
MADKVAIGSNKTEHSTRANWSQLPIDPFQLILSKLSVRNIKPLEAVCRPWLKAIKYISASSPSFACDVVASACLPEPPRLLLFQDEDNDGGRLSGFCSLKGKFYSLMNMPKELGHGYTICIGSSHGWLLFLTNKKRLLLLNPASAAAPLLLPQLNTFPDIDSIMYQYPPMEDSGIFLLKGTCGYWRKRMCKVVLSSPPTCSNKNNIGVLLMYNVGDGRNRLAFCTPADNKWTKLDEHERYLDVTSDCHRFYALREDYSVEVWGFPNSSAIKKLETIPAGAPMVAKLDYNFQLYMDKTDATDLFLVKTGASDLFLVAMVDSSACETVRFDVYKLEYNPDGTSRWRRVDSIGKYAVVLGSNHSILISPQEFDHAPGYHGNSIYFLHASSSFSYDLIVYNLREIELKKVCYLGLLKQPAYWLERYPFSTSD